jgi:hypothetical protein
VHVATLGDDVSYAGIGVRLILSMAVAVGAAAALSSQASAADMATKAPPQMASSDAYSSVLWLSGDFQNNVSDGSVGGIYALSGNLDAPGWLVRGQYTYAGFDDFNAFSLGTGTGHGTFSDGSGLIGYQIVGNGVAASGYVGIDYQSYHFNPASANTNGLGDRAGLMLAGRVATVGANPYSFAIDGQYSTAYNEFWVRARPGAKFGSLTVGPEVVGLGNNVFDQVRGGGFASYEVARGLTVEADLGYADATGNNNSGSRGGSGIYGGVTLVLLH